VAPRWAIAVTRGIPTPGEDWRRRRLTEAGHRPARRPLAANLDLGHLVATGVGAVVRGLPGRPEDAVGRDCTPIVCLRDGGIGVLPLARWDLATLEGRTCVPYSPSSSSQLACAC